MDQPNSYAPLSAREIDALVNSAVATISNAMIDGLDTHEGISPETKRQVLRPIATEIVRAHTGGDAASFMERFYASLLALIMELSVGKKGDILSTYLKHDELTAEVVAAIHSQDTQALQDAISHHVTAKGGDETQASAASLGILLEIAAAYRTLHYVEFIANKDTFLPKIADGTYTIHPDVSIAMDGGTVQFDVEDENGTVHGLYIDRRMNTETNDVIYKGYPGEKFAVALGKNDEVVAKVMALLANGSNQ